MPSRSALTPDGRHLAMVHGARLYVARLSNELAPATVLELPGNGTAVAASDHGVFVVTDTGILVQADTDGRQLVSAELEAPAIDVAANREHVVAFTAQGVVRWFQDGTLTEVRCPGIVAGTCGRAGWVVVSTPECFRSWNPDDSPSGVQEAEAANVLLAFGDDHVLVGSKERVLYVQRDLSVRRQVTQAEGHVVRYLGASPRGDVLAIGLDDNIAIAMALPSRETVGQLSLESRTIVGVHASPHDQLVVGLDQGDGNTLDLRTGEMGRTDPPDGEERRRWLVAVASFPEHLEDEDEDDDEDDEPAPRHPDARPPTADVDPRWIDEVRRCQRCGEPAAVPLRNVAEMQLGRPTGRMGRRDYRCQSCGNRFQLRQRSTLSTLFGTGALLSGMASLSLLVIAPFADSLTSALTMGAVFVGLGVPLVIGGWLWVRPTYRRWRNPLVLGASLPPLRYPRPDPVRRSTCGAWAAVEEVEPAWRDGPQTSLSVTYRYRCHACDETFETEDLSDQFVPVVITLAMASSLLPFAYWVWQGTIDWTSALCTLLPGILGALATLGLGLRIREWAVDHPVDRNEPPVDDPQLL